MVNEERLKRLHSLKELKPGWMQTDVDFKPYGEAISEESIKAVEQFYGIMQAMVEKPRFYPTPEGGVSVEWDYGDFHFDTQFDKSGILDDTIMGLSIKTEDPRGHVTICYDIKDTTNVQPL